MAVVVACDKEIQSRFPKAHAGNDQFMFMFLFCSFQNAACKSGVLMGLDHVKLPAVDILVSPPQASCVAATAVASFNIALRSRSLHSWILGFGTTGTFHMQHYELFVRILGFGMSVEVKPFVRGLRSGSR